MSVSSGREINLLHAYPKSSRDPKVRVREITNEIREIARTYGKEYFDGDRRYGYGGYSYHPRFWRETVSVICDYYKLKENARILDIGCAKGFMLYEFQKKMPDAVLRGLDISHYAIENAIDSIKPFLQTGCASTLPYEDCTFDLVLSINTLHNLELRECKQALKEIERVSGGNSFIVVDAWSSEEERERMRQWVITAKTMMHVDHWKELFDQVGYTGDYFWFVV